VSETWTIADVGAARVAGPCSALRKSEEDSCRHTWPQIKVARMPQRKSIPRITSSNIVGRTRRVMRTC